MRRRNSRREKLITLALYLGLAAGLFFAAFPIYWMLGSSLKPNSEIFALPPTILPRAFTLEAYKAILTDPVKLRFFFNSYLVAMLVTIITVLLALLAAYGFSRFNFRGKGVAVDGGSSWTALWRVIVPISLPGIVATAVYTFLLCWNEFLFALTLTKSTDMRTVPIGIQLLMGQHAFEWNQMMAMSVLGSVPLLLIYLLAQRYFLAGMSAGAVK